MSLDFCFFFFFPKLNLLFFELVYKTMNQKYKIIIFREDILTLCMDDSQLVEKLKAKNES